MNENFIHTKMLIGIRFLKAHVIPMSELKHEVFDGTVSHS